MYQWILSWATTLIRVAQINKTQEPNQFVYFQKDRVAKIGVPKRAWSCQVTQSSLNLPV